MFLSLQSSPIPPPSPVFQLFPLGLLVVPLQNNEGVSCWLREPISWRDVGHIGDPVAQSLGVMAWKRWLLPTTCPHAELRALPECGSRPSLTYCYMGMGILVFFMVMSFKFLFTWFICLSLPFMSIWDDLKNELKVPSILFRAVNISFY